MKDEWFGKIYYPIIDSGKWADLSYKARSVYVVLLKYASWNTGVCMPTQKTIARLSGIYRTSISEATKELETKGLIKTWMKMLYGRKRLYYKVIEPKEGITPINTTLQPKGKRTVKGRDPKTGKFSSPVVKYGTVISANNGIDTTDNNGDKRDIRKRDSKENNKETQNPLSFSNNETTKPSWVTSDFSAYHFFSVEYRQELYRKHGKEGKDKLINAALKFGLVDREFDNPLSEQELAKITECIESEGKDGKEIPAPPE